jgi:2-oxoglutarate dehydrogenase E1 component
MMDELVQRGGGYGAKEIVVGMAHRGRLAVLVNIFGRETLVEIDFSQVAKL